jgi:hypothetical protein
MTSIVHAKTKCLYKTAKPHFPLHPNISILIWFHCWLLPLFLHFWFPGWQMEIRKFCEMKIFLGWIFRWGSFFIHQRDGGKLNDKLIKYAFIKCLFGDWFEVDSMDWGFDGDERFYSPCTRSYIILLTLQKLLKSKFSIFWRLCDPEITTSQKTIIHNSPNNPNQHTPSP